MAKFYKKTVTNFELFGKVLAKRTSVEYETSTEDDKDEDWDNIILKERIQNEMDRRTDL